MFALLAIVFYACSLGRKDDIRIENLDINLRWYTGSFNQTEEGMKIGLAWSLSYLGALLPAGSLDEAMTFKEDKIFSIDLSKVGFSEQAQTALQKIVAHLKESDEYRGKGHIELGRFVMLTLNSSYHYFQITGVPATLQGFINTYNFGDKKVKVANSSIALHERLIEVADADNFEEIAYLCTECTGSFQTNTFEAKEYETLDFMPNGQLRFGIYDINGKLKPVADQTITLAGKPSKCIWCHEIIIQPFFRTNPVFEEDDCLSEQEFSKIREQQSAMVSQYRKSINDEIDFDQKQDHQFMERIYIDFMEPSIRRLTEEWGVSLDDAKKRLNGLPTHTQEEFGFTDLYDRKYVDQIGTQLPLQVPHSTREFSPYEPDFF